MIGLDVRLDCILWDASALCLRGQTVRGSLLQ